jgi:transcriptional regulator with XRE-family HTH domain
MEKHVSRSTQDWEEHVGAAIRRLRQGAALTQKALAERANISLSSLQALELGRGSSLTTVVKVVRSLGRSEWFEALAPPEPSISPREQWRLAQ